MRYINAISGGKDSEAVEIWAKNNLTDYESVFCDTGWESPKTYAHLAKIEAYTGKQIKRLVNEKYPRGFIDLCISKKRFASTKARFCTEELKVKPMIDYILSLKEDVTVLQGVRNDESQARANLKKEDEYFKFYFEPYGYDKKGKPKYHTYRKKEVVEHCNKYSVDVLRPIISWSAQDVFDYLFKNGQKGNELYYEGFARVGCFPCISCRHSEIRLIAQAYPERVDLIREAEKIIGTTFFPPNYIPKEYCDKAVMNKKGTMTYFATIDAVVRYVLGNPDQTKLFDMPKGCISVYSICESSK